MSAFLLCRYPKRRANQFWFKVLSTMNLLKQNKTPNTGNARGTDKNLENDACEDLKLSGNGFQNKQVRWTAF